MSLLKDVQKTIQNLDLMRHVSVTIYVAHAASAKRQEEDGLSHSNVISENFIAMPSKIDIMDTSGLKLIREMWKRSVARQADDQPVLHNKDETVEEKFARLLTQTTTSKENMMAMIDAAKYPVPNEFSVILPQEARPIRKEIISLLVPFQQTREMLLRLEDNLELPMRHVSIMHSRAHAVDELKATIN